MTAGRVASIDFGSLDIGQSIGEREVLLSRSDLVRYSGAASDFNPIHFNDFFAQSVGLPGVIAHGMLTMGLAASLIEQWNDNMDPGAIIDYQTRFTKPVVVDNDMGDGDAVMGAGARLVISGVIGDLDSRERIARIDLTVISYPQGKSEGEKVLVKAQARVAFGVAAATQ